MSQDIPKRAYDLARLSIALAAAAISLTGYCLTVHFA